MPIMRATKRSDAAGVLRQKSGYLFAFCVFLVFMQAGMFAGHRHKQLASYPDVSSDMSKTWLSETRLSGRTRQIKEHPIPRLMEEAENMYRRKGEGKVGES